MIGAILSSSVMILNNTLVFGDTDINTALFDPLDTIPIYKSPGIRQWGGKMANNTAYNNRHSDMGMIIAGDKFVAGEEKTYNTERDYRNKYIFATVDIHSAAISLPIFLFTGSTLATDSSPMQVWVMLQLTTTYQTFMSTFQIRALNSGGFMIRYASAGADVWLVAHIHEVRNIVGT